jgi:hypothetical protein
MLVFVLLCCVVLLVHLKVKNVCVCASKNVESQKKGKKEKKEKVVALSPRVR